MNIKKTKAMFTKQTSTLRNSEMQNEHMEYFGNHKYGILLSEHSHALKVRRERDGLMYSTFLKMKNIINNKTLALRMSTAQCIYSGLHCMVWNHGL